MARATEVTEWTYAGELAGWITAILSDIGSFLTRAVCEERVISTGKRPDILVYSNTGEIQLTITVKRPSADVDIFGEDLRAEACAKARSVEAPYAATHDVNQFVLWDARTEQRVYDFTIIVVSELSRYRAKEQEIKNSMRVVLSYYMDLLRGRRTPRRFDEGVPKALVGLVDGFIIEGGIAQFLARQFRDDAQFRDGFDRWVLDEGRAKPDTDQQLEHECERLARQFLYTFINKAIFYYVLRSRYPRLSRLTLPLDGSHEIFHEVLNVFLIAAQRESGDYETVFQTDFVDTIPIPDSAVGHLSTIIRYIGSLDYADIPYDVIGGIFERLVDQTERHYMGQFFTPVPVVDLILGFCQRDAGAVGLDPGCGSGTFLVRMYYRYKYLDAEVGHEQLLERIWGIDIARFPAHLSTINLAIRDLSSHENYPIVIAEDFFDVEGTGSSVTIGLRQESLPLGFEEETKQLSADIIRREVPPMNFVVGNPPYTRHEELHEEIFGEDYKQKLEDCLGRDFPGLSVSKQAGIYAYFIPHGLRFLQNGGDRLGYVTLSSWLDANFGEGLKELLLTTTKIIAIVESRVERWFETTQMLPLILIVERVQSPQPLNEQQVKFVRLTKPLSQVIPLPTEGNETANIRHWQKVDELTEAIEQAEQQDGEVFALQNTQLTEVQDDPQVKYVRTNGWETLCVPQSSLRSSEKWGKYLRAPIGYFKALGTHPDLIVPLGEGDNPPAFVTRGITTGAQAFFCLENAGNPFDVERIPDEYMLRDPAGRVRFRLPVRFVYPGVTKIKPYRTLSIQRAEDLIFSCPLEREQLEQEFPGVLAYVEWGESQGYHETATCRDRANSHLWYDLGIRQNRELVMPGLIWDAYRVHYNQASAIATDCQAELCVSAYPKALCAILNSTFTALCVEFSGRYIENRDRTLSNQLKIMDIKSIRVIDPRRIDDSIVRELEEAFDNLCHREVLPAWDEVAQDDRRRLDDIVFKDILGLSDDEANDLRQAYVSAVQYRIQRANTSDSP